jgi:hypothetical protein
MATLFAITRAFARDLSPYLPNDWLLDQCENDDNAVQHDEQNIERCWIKGALLSTCFRSSLQLEDKTNLESEQDLERFDLCEAIVFIFKKRFVIAVDLKSDE